ncbi:CNNM domain-containing protein [Mycoplasma procyoni]|uniref:CNNM domain-containing protein n=1 Tax=Mycoplasma procyoni TaxID=568784 RepID=UPI00197BBA80|nr:hemolysin family protein [Mycoplasma procyoni]MBN3534459.1 HlyC/CorC family transporter [Mycoplasma procyoni]
MDTVSYIVFSILLFILLILSALFSASETAFSSVTKAKIEENLDPKKTFAKKVIKKRYESFSSTLSTILIGNNIVNIAASLLLSSILASLITDNVLEIIVSTAVMTPIIVIFGEIIPKVIARKRPLAFLKRTYLIIYFFYLLFWPLTFLISKFVKENQVTNTENELKQILDIGYKEGVLEKEESILARNALDFDSIKLQKHYVRLKNITYINHDDSLDKIQKKFIESGFSRLPIKKKKQFVGILLLKDVYHKTKEDFNIDELIVEVPYVSANSLLKIALKKMKENRTQFAFVTKNNDDKSVVGIITFEDVLEELVGEIYDEHDFRDELDLYEIEETKVIAKYSTKIEKINEVLKTEIPEDKEIIGKYLEELTNKKLTLKFNYKEENLSFKVVENKKGSEQKIEISLDEK